jgi:DNA repair protein RAD5
MTSKEEDTIFASEDEKPDAKPREKLFLIDTSDEDAPSGTGRKRKRSRQGSPRVKEESGVKKEDQDVVMLSSPEVIRIAKKPSTMQKPTRETKPKTKARLQTFERGLIGTCYCSAWSLTKGKGYCSPGSKIVIERPKTKEEKEAERLAKSVKSVGTGKAGTTVIKNGKIVKKATSTIKPTAKPITGKAAATSANNPGDTIIRFSNARGFEIGRLPTAIAKHLAPLLAADLIHLSGTVVDCPPVLTVGCDVVLEVWVYLTKKAFTSQEKREDVESDKVAWGKEGETSVQRELRMRKDALAKLFERVSLKPVQSSALTRSQKVALAPNGAGKGKGKATGSKASSPAEVIEFNDSSDEEVARPANGKAKVNGKPKEEIRSVKGKEKAVDGPKLVKREGMLDGEEDDVESGDEAEVLDEKQLHDLESIFNRYVASAIGSSSQGSRTDVPFATEPSSRVGCSQRWNRQRRSCTRCGRIKNRRSGTSVRPVVARARLTLCGQVDDSS